MKRKDIGEGNMTVKLAKSDPKVSVLNQSTEVIKQISLSELKAILGSAYKKRFQDW